MTPNPCQTSGHLLFSVIACALNYRQVASFVKAMNAPFVYPLFSRCRCASNKIILAATAALSDSTSRANGMETR